jgi:HTH-type transcriptional regulator / antitoxin HigA
MGERSKNEYWPTEVSPPGATLRELLEQRGITQADLAERMGRPKKTINEIIRGKAAITPETALQLELVLRVEAEFWNRREQSYREYLARVQERARLQAHAQWVKQFPVSSMAHYGWIRKCTDRPSQVRELLQFFEVGSPEQWLQLQARQKVAFRCAKAFELDPAAIAAWLQQGLRTAQAVPCEPFDAESFRRHLGQVRSLTWEAPGSFVPRLRDLCAEVGVAVALVPEMPRSRVSGATRWIAPTKAMIQLSLRYKTNDHLWFTFFHEAGHILLHGRRTIFLEAGKSVDDLERQADSFAADLLIPPADLRRFAERHDFSGRSICAFANKVGVAPGIVVGRLQHDGLLRHDQFNGLKQRLAWAA